MNDISPEGFVAIGIGLGIALFLIGGFFGWVFRMAWEDK